jgi:hypothetical protein
MSTTQEKTSVTTTARSPPKAVYIPTRTEVTPTETQNDHPRSPSNIAAALTRMVATVASMKSDQTTAKNVRTEAL